MGNMINGRINVSETLYYSIPSAHCLKVKITGTSRGPAPSAKDPTIIEKDLHDLKVSFLCSLLLKALRNLGLYCPG